MEEVVPNENSLADPKTEDRLDVGLITTVVLASNIPLILVTNWLDDNTALVSLEILLTKLDDCKLIKVVEIVRDDNVDDGEMALDEIAVLIVMVFTLSNVTDEDNIKDV